MSALELLNNYDTSDSEDDEVSNSEKSNESLKRLPLPGSIASWKGVPHHEEPQDDPLTHDGRTRSFKHERGNWPTLIYIDYVPSEAMISWMSSVSREIPVKCNLFPDQFHISLTRTLILKFHWIESFVEGAKKLCEQTSRFNLDLLNVKSYTNDEKNRTFVGIECVDYKGIVDRFVGNINRFLAEYELPPFYEDSSYHVSFLWCLGDELATLNDHANSIAAKLNQFLAEHPEERCLNVAKVHLKIGNKLYVFQLN